MFSHRLQSLRSRLSNKDLDGLIITKPENQFYISGFTGEGVLLVTSKTASIVTDFRYTQQSKEESPDFDVIECPTTISQYQIVRDLVEASEIATIGVEYHHLTVKAFDEISHYLQGKSLRKISGIVEELRSQKDDHELKIMREAQKITDKTFEHILSFIKPGVSEISIANEMEYFMKQNGADKTAFGTIVASGPRGALPHGVPTERKLQNGDMITLDFGAQYKNYCSDMTRTVVLGKANDKQIEIYNTVLKAQKTALEYIRSGLTGKEVDKVARDVISERGFGDNFGHGLGHAVGLEIHEDPRLSPKGHMTLYPGNVVTIEPGIYIEGFGGVRIEDMVVVLEDGCENLTSSPKELLYL